MGRNTLITSTLLVCAILALPSCKEAPETVAGQELQQGSIGVIVDRYELRILDFQAASGAVLTTQNPLLLIYLTVTNRGNSTARYDTRDSVNAASQAITPLLFIDPGSEQEWRQPSNIIALAGPGDYTYPEDPINGPTVIPPGQSIHDILLFEAPPGGTTGLVLSLPPSVFGPEVEMPGIFRISYAAPEPIRPEVHDMNLPIQGDGFLLTVTGTEIAYFPNTEHTGFTEAPVLGIRYTLQNTSEQALTYRPAHRDPRGELAPALGVEGRFWERVHLPDNQRIEGQLSGAQSILPGASIQDMAIFERPEPDYNELLFLFRGQNLGRTGQLRVRILYSYQDPPLPPELQEPQPAPEPVVPTEGEPPAEGGEAPQP